MFGGESAYGAIAQWIDFGSVDLCAPGMIVNNNRAALEAEFMHLCRMRGPQWIESVIRPLVLPGAVIVVEDIPLPALFAIVRMFRRVGRRTTGTA